MSSQRLYTCENRVKWPNNELIGPDLNKSFFTLFPKKLLLAKSLYCVNCERNINPDEYRDKISKSEYSISGLCQFCQDTMFDICT